MKVFRKLVVILNILSIHECYKILGIFPETIKSHFIIAQSLMKELSHRGHDVTVVSHYPTEQSLPRYKDVSLNGILPLFVEQVNLEDLQNLSRYHLYHTPFQLNDWAEKLCKAVYSSGKLNALLKSFPKFDLIIVEMFNTDCFLPINLRLDVPVIGMSSCYLLPWINERFGIPSNPSYIPGVFMDYSNQLTFLERFENLITTWMNLMIFQWRNWRDDQISRVHLDKNMPYIWNFINSVSLLLVNTHFSLNYARPFPPNVIEVGGLHLEKSKNLPSNIEKFINESIHGVIYFSLGSMIKGHTFPEEKRKEFLRAFARLPQRVLWKWENETMPGKPDNVLILKWMPQFDILSHPNVKAFISHGGLLGTTEAVHCGVPMIVMPQYGDQHTNAKAVEVNGGGIVLYLREASEEKVYESLKSILDPKFKSKVEALSTRFRDRPMSPMDTAVYWVEYVARHKGAPHLRTSAVDMPLYQYLLLDVLAFLLAIILLFLFAMYKIIRFILKVSLTKKKVKQS